MKRSWKAMFALLLVGALLIAGCGGGAQQPSSGGDGGGSSPSGSGSSDGGAAKQAPATIKIGAAMSITGRYGSGGSQVRQGYELAVEQINADGGVYVKEFDKKIPLELIVQDDESDPVKAVQLMETLFGQHDITAYFGGFGSDMHAASAAIAEKNRVPYLGVTFGLEQIHHQGYKYLFSPFPKSTANSQIFSVLKELMPAEDYPKSVAVFYENTDWGKELGPMFRDQATANGVEVVAYETYQPGSADFSDIINKAKAAGAEMLVGMPTPPDGIAIAKQMGELGWVPKAALFVRAPDNPAWAESTGELGNNFMFAPGWSWTAQHLPGVPDLVAAYEAKHGAKPPPNVGPGYACVQLLAAAIEQAGTLDRDAIRDALAAIDMPTVVGNITFDEVGIGSATNFFNQWQDGEVVNIWPRESGGTFRYPLR